MSLGSTIGAPARRAGAGESGRRNGVVAAESRTEKSGNMLSSWENGRSLRCRGVFTDIVV